MVVQVISSHFGNRVVFTIYLLKRNISGYFKTYLGRLDDLLLATLICCWHWLPYVQIT